MRIACDGRRARTRVGDDLPLRLPLTSEPSTFALVALPGRLTSAPAETNEHTDASFSGPRKGCRITHFLRVKSRRIRKRAT